jgi:hypothetical protein
MDIILERMDKQKLKISIFDWIFFLNFAEWYGWNPKGTLPPKNSKEQETWDGRYDSNEGQVVAAQDSKCLAIALQAAIDDSIYESRLEDVYLPLFKALREKYNLKPLIEFDPFEIKNRINALISFCKNNEFYLN